MKVRIDEDLCIACGDCIEICPEVFGWNEEESAKEAVESCPTDAIEEI